MRMKRIVKLMFALMMFLVFTGCGKGDSGAAPSGEKKETGKYDDTFKNMGFFSSCYCLILAA